MDKETPKNWTLNPLSSIKMNYPNNIPNDFDYWERNLLYDLIYQYNTNLTISNSYLNFIIDILTREKAKLNIY